MPKVFIVRTGQTTLEAQDRIGPTGGAPLTEIGRRTVESVAAELVSQEIQAIYAGDGESEHQTAAAMSKALGLKVRTSPDLRELDYGLWQGLTRAELKRRQPRMYRQWAGRPDSVCPPGGETLDRAQQRLKEALKNILKRAKGRNTLLVLRPVATGLLRCLLTGQGVGSLWRYVDAEFTWESYEMDATSF